MNAQTQNRAGYTLIEVMIVLVLVTVVVMKAVLFVNSASTSAGQHSVETVLEDQARSVMDQIGLAVMASDRESLNPFDTPFYTTEIKYKISLGVDVDGAIIWEEPEQIKLDGDGQQIAWLKSPRSSRNGGSFGRTWCATSFRGRLRTTSTITATASPTRRASSSSLTGTAC